MKIETLFELIESLSKSEKRYFKIFVKGRETKYLEFYNLLNDSIKKKKSIDSNLLKTNFLNRGVRLDLLIDSLFNIILKSLSQFYSNTSLDVIMKNQLIKVEVLHKKGLVGIAIKELKDLKKKANSNEKFIILLDVNSWEKKLYETGVGIYSLENIISERIEILELLRNYSEFDLLFRRVFIHYENYGLCNNREDVKRLKFLQENTLLMSENKIKSSRALIAFYNIKRLLAKLTHDTKEQHLYALKIINVFNEKSQLKLEFLKEYTKHLLDLQTAQRDCQLYNDVIKTQQKIEIFEKETYVNENKALKGLIFFHTTINLVRIYRETNQSGRVIKMIPELEIKIKEYEIQVKYWYVLNYNLAAACFENKQFNEALKWILKIINSKEKNLRADVYIYSRILFLLIHFELDNRDFLEYELRSIYRFIHKKRSPMKVELLLVSFIRNTKSNLGVKKSFIELKDRFEENMKDPFEKRFLYYFDIVKWLNSKINLKS